MPTASPAPANSLRGSSLAAALVLAAVALLVPLSALRDVRVYGVDVPVGDQWSIAPMFERLDAGSAAPHGLFGQANESRPAVPRLIFLALARIGHWDVKREMYATQGLLGLTSLGLVLVSRRLGAGWLQTAAALAVGNMALFSSANFANFLWGIQFIVYVPFACLVWLAAVASGPGGNGRAFATAAVLCAVATYSYANGMLLWPVGGLVLLVTRGSGLRAARWWALWAAAGLASVLYYFAGYQHPAQHPGFSAALHAPGDAVLSVLAFFGASLSFEGRLAIQPFWVAATAGFLVVSAVAGSLAVVSMERRDGPLVRAAGVWACLAAYGVGSAVLTVAGRLGFGREYVLVSRYVAFSGTTIAAAAFLAGVVRRHLRDSGRARPAACVGHVVACLAGVYVALWSLNAWECRAHLGEWRRTRLQARALLPMVDVADPADVGVLLFQAGPGGLPRLWRGLVARDVLPDLSPTFAASDGAQGRGCGAVESVIEEPDGSVDAAGFTYIPASERAGDAVLVTSGEPGGRRALAVAIPREPRRDVVESTGAPRAIISGWRLRFRPPADGQAVEFWTLDGDTRRACRLARPGGGSGR